MRVLSTIDTSTILILCDNLLTRYSFVASIPPRHYTTGVQGIGFLAFVFVSRVISMSRPPPNPALLAPPRWMGLLLIFTLCTAVWFMLYSDPLQSFHFTQPVTDVLETVRLDTTSLRDAWGEETHIEWISCHVRRIMSGHVFDTTHLQILFPCSFPSGFWFRWARMRLEV